MYLHVFCVIQMNDTKRKINMQVEQENSSNIFCLPDEILTLILRNNSPRGILNFGATCKRYNDVVKNNKSLWKYTCANTFPSILCKVIEEYHGSNWLHEMKRYIKFKQELHSELIDMSAVHYWKLSERSLDNVTNFFAILNKTNFFYALHILQDVIKVGNKVIDKYECIKPYTLTETYYSKTVLRHFIHTYLAVKWAKAKLEKDLPPELVINFFLQWIDPSNLYLDEEVQKKINVLTVQVNNILQHEKKGSKGQYSGLQIIQAVTRVIYKQRRIAITTATDVNTLDICKVIDTRCGNFIVVAAIYQAVATRCGACCELIVFPNHLFLEWKDLSLQGHQLYNIDLRTGDIYPKRQCPFASQSNPTNKYSYCPESLLQYIYSSFVITMGVLRTWNTQNAMYILDFLGTDNEQSTFSNSPYKNYLSHLMESENILKQCNSPNLKQLSDEHIQLITSVADLNTAATEVPSKQKIPKRHSGNVKFAVGMICYHKRYDYVCIVRGWDVTGCQLHFPLDDLYFGRSQPFYYITAADQSERYVAQENLMELTRPTRLYHLEHQISRDFTYFDGFAYALNDQKKLEYPDDQHIVEVFRLLCQQKPSNI